MPVVDISGQRFGKLVAINAIDERTDRGAVQWNCVCDCGSTSIASGQHLRSGNTTSCGCVKANNLATSNLSHGKSGTPEHTAWVNMRQRCLNPNNPEYPDYGGRGISIDPRWKDSFENFHADMGDRPEGKYSIEREKVDGNYEPGNCKWLPSSEQPANRRNTVFHEHNGERVMESELARRHGISQPTLRARLAKGLSLEEALTKEKWSRK